MISGHQGFRRLRKAVIPAYVALSSVILLLTACGSGGGGDSGGNAGGGGDSITYTGLTTQAAITNANAVAIATAGYQWSSTGNPLVTLGVVPTTEGEQATQSSAIEELLQVVADVIRRAHAASRTPSVAAGAVVEYDRGTINGTCGGSSSYVENVDDQTGRLTGSVTFNNYCDGGITISGTATESGQVDLATDEITSLTVSFSSLTITAGGGSFTYAGDMTFVFGLSSITGQMNVLMRDAGTGTVYWAKGYNITISGTTTVTINYSGQFYHPDYGYVTVSTPTPLDSSGAGVVVLTGSGNTRTRVTIMAPTTIRVEADTNGDGTIDCATGSFNVATPPFPVCAPVSNPLPPAPTGITAVAGDGQVTVSWNAVSGTTSYNLYGTSVSGVTKSNYSTLPDGVKHTGVASPYTDTGLTNGKTYYFVVTAVNATGESTESMEVTATPITARVLQSISVTPSNSSIIADLTQQFNAIGNYSDGSTNDISTLVAWSSGTPDVAIISSSGLATGTGIGTATITATSGTISGNTALLVTAPALQSISVTPEASSIPKGTTQQFTATGTYLDGTTHNISALVAWRSSIGTVSTVTTSGLATGVGTGTATISATLGSSSGSAVLTVTLALLESISVTPTNTTITQGATQQFIATGAYSDGSSQNISTLVTWSSDTTTVATVNVTGLVTGTDIGTATITATSGTILGNTALTVVLPGVLWTRQTDQALVLPYYLQHPHGIAWSGTLFVVVGPVAMYTGGYILTSPDGIAWTKRLIPYTAQSLLGVAWSGTQFVAVGGYGTIRTSPDGMTWTAGTSGTINELSSVAWSGTQFVAVGANGVILTSPDGITWTSMAPGISNYLSGVTWSGTQFVAVGDIGTILTSSDGINWVNRLSGTSRLLRSITWSGTQFVAVGDIGTIITSSNGINWTDRTLGAAYPLSSVACSTAQCVVVGGYARASIIFTSPDGITWTSRVPGAFDPLRGIVWSGTKFVAVGGLPPTTLLGGVTLQGSETIITSP